MNLKAGNTLFAVLASVLSLGVVLFSTVKVCETQAQAQMGLDPSPSSGAQVEVLDTQTVNVVSSSGESDYYLPYPGILPDHPLYWLKMLRDRILLFLVHNPEEKLNRLLLYADKRLGAAQVLIMGGKDQLGITTATKAEKYLEQAVLELEKIKTAGNASETMFTNLAQASLKHRQVLEQMVDKVPDQSKSTVQQAVEKAKTSFKKATELGGIKVIDESPSPQPVQTEEECGPVSCPIE